MRGTTHGTMLALCACLSACQTTGDPRQGGLFGWSEAQARQRQEALGNEDAQARQRLQAEQARGTELRGRQTGLDQETVRLQAQIDALADENLRLGRDLQQLMARRGVAGTELTRLQQLLRTNEQARLARQATAAQRPVSEMSMQADTLNGQNQQLQREVAILLQR